MSQNTVALLLATCTLLTIAEASPWPFETGTRLAEVESNDIFATEVPYIHGAVP